MSLDLYKQYQPKLRTGDLLSWSSDSALGWLIRKFTKSDVNHSGMVIEASHGWSSYTQESSDQ